MELAPYLDSFLEYVRGSNLELYNEFSLQHELGIYLRSVLPEDLRVQFERPKEYFGIREKLGKREVDISVFTRDKDQKFAIELKFPRNGQHPEQMFAACKDIAFLEQLVRYGFAQGYFLMLAEDPLFYERGSTEGIYRFFRSDSPLSGRITKPTGRRDEQVDLLDSYQLDWNELRGEQRYLLLEVPPVPAPSFGG